MKSHNVRARLTIMYCLQGFDCYTACLSSGNKLESLCFAILAPLFDIITGLWPAVIGAFGSSLLF